MTRAKSHAGLHRTLAGAAGAALLLIGFASVVAGTQRLAPRPVAALTTCGTSGPVVHLAVGPVRVARGRIVVELYGANPDHFLSDDENPARFRVGARPPENDICINVEKPGTYALVVHHDVDDNGKFNRSWIGLPLEPYGFSNNPKIGLSAPDFHEVAFTVGASGARVRIIFNE